MCVESFRQMYWVGFTTVYLAEIEACLIREGKILAIRRDRRTRDGRIIRIGRQPPLGNVVGWQHVITKPLSEFGARYVAIFG